MFEIDTEYIYTLTDPRDNAVRYVGKTNNPRNRYQQHLTQFSNNKEKDAWVQELCSTNLQPIMNIIEEIDDSRPRKEGAESPWYTERCWIKHYLAQGAQLFNAPLKEPQQFPIVFLTQATTETPTITGDIKQMIQENKDLREEIKRLQSIIRNVTKALE